jgi:hypothetical protein
MIQILTQEVSVPRSFKIIFFVATECCIFRMISEGIYKYDYTENFLCD